MTKNKKLEQENGQENDLAAAIMAASGQEGSMQFIEVRVSMLSLAKDILERNAALQWEQDKTKGLTISCDAIILEAKKLLEFVFEDAD
jgi:hypothetical protein